MTKLRQLWLLTALASLAVLAGGYFLVVSPKASAAKSLRTEAEEQSDANRALQHKIQMLNAQKKDLPKLQAELDKFNTKIPDNPELPKLVRSLSDAADSSGVNLVAVTPSVPTLATANGAVAAAPSATTAIANIPVTVKVRGSYAQLAQFFSEIEGLPRAFLVTGAKVTPDKGDTNAGSAVAGNPLSAEVTGRLFMTTKAPAPVAPAAPADATN